MAEYIKREETINAIQTDCTEQIFYSKDDAIDRIKAVPAADVVSRAVYDQTAWERDLALQQLKSIGKGLGEQMDDVAPVRHARWLTWEEMFPGEMPKKKNNLGVFCSSCKNHADNMFDYCPNCGAKMDGGTLNG